MGDSFICNTTISNMPMSTFFDPFTNTFLVMMTYPISNSASSSCSNSSTFSDSPVSNVTYPFLYSNIFLAMFCVTNSFAFFSSTTNSLSANHSASFPLSTTNTFSTPFLFSYALYAISSTTNSFFPANLFKI
jgi:hypothetical protein